MSLLAFPSSLLARMLAMLLRFTGHFICFVLALSSCTAVSGDDLAQKYQQRTRELGLFPVYPPREEFQIGDVY
ncbi:MAG: hypothetical protein ACK46Q_16560, partial [Hyphomonas sp.]